METGKYDIQVSAVSMSGRNSLPGFQKAAFLLCPHIVERGSSSVYPFSYKNINPIIAPPLTPSKPNNLLMDTPSNTITLGIRVSTYTF